MAKIGTKPADYILTDTTELIGIDHNTGKVKAYVLLDLFNYVRSKFLGIFMRLDGTSVFTKLLRGTDAEFTGEVKVILPLHSHSPVTRKYLFDTYGDGGDPYNYLPVDGSIALTGDISGITATFSKVIKAESPAANNDLANLKFMNDNFAKEGELFHIDGSVDMEGELNGQNAEFSGNVKAAEPTSLDNAVTKNFVLHEFINKEGDELDGPITGSKAVFSSNVSVPLPVDPDSAVNLEFLQAAAILTRIPTGMIALWHGDVANIPLGWALCDGSSDEIPDLSEAFILAGSYNSKNLSLLGSKDAKLGLHNHTASFVGNPLNPHYHSYQTLGIEGDWYGFTSENDFTTVVYSILEDAPYGTPVGGVAVNQTTGGVDPAGANMPPYYRLPYIIKVST